MKLIKFITLIPSDFTGWIAYLALWVN